jgi:hypothetical protein
MSRYDYKYKLADEHLVAKVERGLRPDPIPGWDDIGIGCEITAGDREVAVAGFFRFAFDHGYDDNDEPTRWPDYDGLIDIADGISAGCYALAEAIKDRWQHHDDESGQAIYDYGDVVMFDSLKIKAASAAESRVVWRLLRAVIHREFQRRRNSSGIVALYAHPSGSRDDNIPMAKWRHRQQALIRIYEKELGFKSFGGSRTVSPGMMCLQTSSPLQPKPIRRRRTVSSRASVAASC